MAKHNRDDLIAGLVADLAPVRPMRMTVGAALVTLATLLTLVVVVLLTTLDHGLDHGIGPITPLRVLVTGVLVVLGSAAAAATLAMASPRVGGRMDGTRWTIAMAAIFPLAALLMVPLTGSGGHVDHAAHSWECALLGTACSALVAGALLVWLRRGAPVSLRRAGFSLGIAAGALGTATYGPACSQVELFHLAFWHFLPVAICAALGVLIVPRLIRW